MAAMLEEQSNKSYLNKNNFLSKWKEIPLYFPSSMAAVNTLCKIKRFKTCHRGRELITMNRKCTSMADEISDLGCNHKQLASSRQ